jgi:hypothetical protein
MICAGILPIATGSSMWPVGHCDRDANRGFMSTCMLGLVLELSHPVQMLS